MNKKVVIILCAVLAFFGGAIWATAAPTIAPIIVFLEILVGATCGFFFSKLIFEEGIRNHKAAATYMKKEGKTLIRTKTPRERIAEVRAEGKAKARKK